MALEAKLYTAEGTESGSVKLDEAFFGREVKMGLIHRLLMLQQANARIAVAHTLTRGERRGSTRKLYKQKGTGHARAGASRSPVRKKGGVAFGPRNDRNFTLMMNKKERRLALKMLLSMKAQNLQVKIIESFSAEKTKDVKAVFANMEVTKGIVALRPIDQGAFRAIRNLPTVKAIGVNYLNPHDLLKFDSLVFTKESLAELAEIYS
jgi:large subunit ribosomal protein L4